MTQSAPDDLAARDALTMPPSVPGGVRMQLARARIRPGASARADEWMAMLNARYDECVATLAGERMAFETIFRLADAEGTDWIYHLAVYGEGGGVLDETSGSLDRDHAAFSRECKEPGWQYLDAQLFMATADVRDAIVRSATGPFAAVSD